MNDFLLYILKSAMCLSLLYLAFRTVMRKEAFFTLNRILLLAVVVFSFIIPLLYLPQTVKPIIQEQNISPVSFHENDAEPAAISSKMEVTKALTPSPVAVQKENPLYYSKGQIIFLIYLAGVLFSLIVFIHGIASVLLMLRKAKAVKKEGYLLFILEKDIPAFSFCKMIFISRADYTKHGTTILAHEQQHIRLGHFYDLMLMEIIKMIHWFNPIIYWLIQDLKTIHEFQADQHTLTKGIDVNKYQLLIIEKGVGSQRFALANSFNHCQIKKRIIMMNQSKTSKAGIWKVATFLPLLALLLMAFGREGEKESVKVIAPPEIIQEQQSPQKGFSVEIRKDGNYLNNQLVSLEEIVKRAKAWQKTNEEILLIVDNQIPFNRVDEVRLALENAKIYFINQKSPNSDEIIYPAGDVTEMAKFTQGKWGDWMKNQIKNLSEGKSSEWEYEIMYGFIIDKNGKARDGHVMKSSGNPEIDHVFEKALSQIPDWQPAKKYNKAVSVYSRISAKTFKPKAVKKNGTSEQESPKQSKDSVYTKVEVMPQFPGGENALRKYIAGNVKYPLSAVKANVQGKVFVNFIITSEGKVTNLKVVRSINPELDAEALRVISMMPTWTPAKDKGKNVNISYTIPINFVLSPDPSDKSNGEIAPASPLNKDLHIITLKQDGSITYSPFPISLKGLEEKIKSELQKNPKLEYNIWVEEGKIDERLDKIRNILKENGNPKVSYFSLHEESKSIIHANQGLKFKD